jgi:glutaredoxin
MLLSAELPLLYLKPGCPWCGEVVEFLATHRIGHRVKNVSQDSAALAEMERISGQTKVPVLDWHGKILADFGVVELKPFLRQQAVKFADR